MNRSRSSQRSHFSSHIPTSRRTLPHRDSSRSTTGVLPDQNRGRQIASRNHGISKQTSIRANETRMQKELTPEEQFEQTCKGFFGGIYRLQIIALLFFSILTIFTQIIQGLFEIALICWGILIGTYALAAVKMVFSNSTAKNEKVKMVYRFLEAIILMFFIGASNLKDDHPIAIILSSVLLGSYLVRTIYSYTINRFKYTNFGNNINNTVLVLRMGIFMQGVLILLQLSLEGLMTWFVVLVPTWISTVAIIMLTILLFKNIYFTHKIEFWKTDITEKKRASRLIFGNLSMLILVLLSLPILVALVYEGFIPESYRPFLGPFVVIVLWCIISLIYIQVVSPDVVKFSLELRNIMDIDEDAEERRIKYVIKISNTYFKIATEQDIQQLKSQNVSTTTLSVLGESEIEATLKRMSSESGKCLVCCKNNADGVFIGCGHGGICFECGREIYKIHKECHLCRDKIQSLLKIKIKSSKEIYYKVIEEVTHEND